MSCFFLFPFLTSCKTIGYFSKLWRIYDKKIPTKIDQDEILNLYEYSKWHGTKIEWSTLKSTCNGKWMCHVINITLENENIDMTALEKSHIPAKRYNRTSKQMLLPFLLSLNDKSDYFILNVDHLKYSLVWSSNLLHFVLKTFRSYENLFTFFMTLNK